jgi:ADP-ribosylglycohydrolase
MAIKQALLSLEGLSVGDGFGQRSFWLGKKDIARRELPPGTWRWTDDTQMALSIVEILREFGHIDQDALAESFARRYNQQPARGYGGGARLLLQRLARGEDWRQVAPQLFPEGSYGNGGAMRAGPIGGYFVGDPSRAAREGKLSAEVTHAHPEGQAGAMGVAAAAAIAAMDKKPEGNDFLLEVAEFLPQSQVLEGVKKALDIPRDQFERAVETLGTGYKVSAQDTVPFCLWVAAYHQTDYIEAMWRTVAGRGDRDTTCAIVGGIVVLSAGGVPKEWVKRREELPEGFSLHRS